MILNILLKEYFLRYYKKYINYYLSNFDIESQILDLSLPFSDNGRTFNIFHAFIKGANGELKKYVKYLKMIDI